MKKPKKAAPKKAAAKKPRKPKKPFAPGEGDLVMLKSGGPSMTVAIRVGPAPQGIKETDVLCMYFVRDEMKSMYFSPKLLRPAEII